MLNLRVERVSTPAMISSSYRSGGNGLQGEMHHEKPVHVSARKCSDRLEYRSDNRLPFRRILHAARQIDVQREDDRPGRRLDPADPTSRSAVRHAPAIRSLPSGSIAPGLDDHDILDQTLMLDLERKLVSIQFFAGNPVPWLKSGGRRRGQKRSTPPDRSALPY